MAVIKCKMCGGDLHPVENASTTECEFCGSVQTVPKVDDEKKLTLFARANRLRAACDFDKAAGIYEAIVAEFPEEAEAYWGLVLCKYGIEYVDDPATGKKIPTCHRSGFDSVMKDSNVELAQEYADVLARRLYREEAKQIEELRKGIIAVSTNEDPYDVFICYKETDFNGKRTLDSVLAQDIYDALNDKGYRVFFSRISLEDKLGTEYEPYIFAALNSAKLMLVIGTDYEYFNAVWVKNEWSRFLKLMAKDQQKHLIPCFKGIDAYDMPEEFARLQAQDLDKMGAIQDIVRGVQKLLPRQEQTVKEMVVVQQTVTQSNPTVASYLKRATMALEDGEWSQADGFVEQVLNIDPENVQAYLVKLLAEMKVSTLEQLEGAETFSENNNNYKKLLRFADEELKATLAECLKRAQEKAEKAKKRAMHDAAEAEFNKNATIKNGVLIKYEGKEKDIYIPYSVSVIGEEAFFCNNTITSVTIPDSVKIIGEMAFSRCETLVSVIIPDSVTSIEKNVFAWCEALTSVTIGKGVTKIGDGAFAGCASLSVFSIPDSVTSIGEEAFYGCESLTTLTIPDCVTQIGANPFTSRSEAMKIIVAEGNKDYCLIDGHLVDVRTKTLISGSPDGQIPSDGSVTSIGKYAFSGCKACTAVTIPNSITSIGEAAFIHCEYLTAVTISACVTQIGANPFSYCAEKLEITVVEGNNDYRVVDGHLVELRTRTLICGNPDRPIPTDGSVTAIGGYAFAGRETLTRLTIPDCVTIIGERAFASCEALTTVTIGNGVTVIGKHTFDFCVALASVDIPDGVAVIEENAFSWCKALTSVTIPESVTSIGDKAFDWCDRITIFASPGSYAWKWAKANGIRVLEDKKTKQAIIAAKRTEREEKENIAAQRRAAGLCRHCGGEFKGLFIKKCISCGRAKDY